MSVAHKDERSPPSVVPALRRTVVVSVVLGAIGFAFADFRVADLPMLWVLKCGQVALVIAALGALRRPTRPGRFVAIALATTTGVCAATAATGVLVHDATTTPILLLLLAFWTALHLPWGTGAQAASVATSLAAAAWNAWAVGGAPALASFAAVVVAGGLVASVWVAAATTRHREAEARAAAALAESEGRFRIMADTAPVLIWLADRDGRRTYFNKGFCDFTGRDAAAIAGDGWLASVHPDDWPLVGTPCATEVGQCTRREFRLRCFDGDWRWILETVSPRCLPSGELVGWVGSCVDITAHRQAEATLARARDEAVEAAQLKSQFLANMSHELRTPMSVVFGMADLLLETTLDADQRDWTERIRRCSETLLAVIEDVLDLAQIETGMLRLEPVPFEPAGIVRDVVEAFGAAAHAKGVALETSVDPAFGVVRGDPGRLRQILVNLVSNAVKFTEAGTVAVRADVLAARDGHVDVRFLVADTGIGIVPDRMHLLFQSFAQVDGSSTRRHEGTGLGLALCKRLVEMMGGRIAVESTPGGGSTFWIEVRLERVRAAAMASASTSSAAA